MKNRILILLILFSIPGITSAQTRLYAFAGVSGNSGGPYWCCKEYKNLFGYGVLDVELEKKMAGSFNLLSGLSVYGVGFSSDDKLFGSAIEYKGTYLSIPLMGRINFKNRNNAYFDFGLNPYYILHAQLKETINKWDGEKTVEGTITPYLNRLNMSAKVQGSLAFNRVLVSAFVIMPFGGQPLAKNLEEHWGLNKQQSTFLLNDDVQGFVFGFKGGYRLR
ncbi:MAG: hypothetical protein WD824_16525 [Cyclobacteriaceae bacterium]